MSFEPLKGIRVLDLTSVVVGPVGTWRLGQYGAEIIKVESPEGDLMRGLGGLSPTGQHSGTYLHLNRGKRNICLDLKKADARQVMERLVASSDVIVANMRPQALERLGLDARSILDRHPDKIYCMITGYGTDGPYSGLPTYDSVIQGVAGVAGLTAVRDGAPTYVPMLVCDHVTGEIAAGAILAAIVERKSSGKGCSMEIPMFETMAAFVLQEHLAQQSFDPPVGPPGDQRLLSPHNKPVKTADGWMSVTVNTDTQVRAFMKATDREYLLGDQRFSSIAARARNVKEWFEIRGAPLISRATAEWLEVFQAADIAAQPCHTLESLQKDRHLKQVGLVSFEEHPTEGRTASIRSTIKVDSVYPSSRDPSQPRGWETRAILNEIGFSEGEIGQLLSDKVALASPERMPLSVGY
ncbi:Crotonobetainyl-CoA:carnitine CoA-transferase CaiB [Collimonas sp. OK607]|uniref:CaiB/BaiF CoA transferase family protein n=1 Tax=Collimonas sp. OK607 TaxID=1798194 RepID=UPI0008E37701|nr:CoA transferase [Collimonas sp. OK607]SFB20961.1 Crotonobetainyl-CoA:carnitine CoA-transferase CaiB [Collimonas sp. OK607]